MSKTQRIIGWIVGVPLGIAVFFAVVVACMGESLEISCMAGVAVAAVVLWWALPWIVVIAVIVWIVKRVERMVGARK